MRSIRSLAVAVVAMCLFCSAAARGADANPQFAGWSKYAVGSSVTMTGETVAGGQKMASTMKTTLVEKGKDSVTVEISVSMNVGGQSIAAPATKQVIPAAGAAAGAAGAAPAAPKEAGEETLTVAGKAIKCKVLVVESDAGGQKATSKVWYSDEIPGGTAKMVAKTAASD
ncbi:MAG TPA: hypothetical protein VF796_14215, partial [Humisphaera sp.]